MWCQCRFVLVFIQCTTMTFSSEMILYVASLLATKVWRWLMISTNKTVLLLLKHKKCD